ncbi:MAG: TonB-dependent receptor [Methylotenera sp.]|nr:TonB-dependent receptor [Methylotenera sp.]
MSKHSIQLVVAWLFACVQVTANAMDVSKLSLEELMEVEIVSSATKMSLKANESPSSIRVITAQDIRRFGWRTLGEALATLPGITHVDDRVYDYLGTRGVVMPGDFNARHLMLIDGTPFSDPLYGAAPIEDVFPIDMALIERIEYVPGSSSAVYGDHAMLGVINITTKSAKGLNHNEASASIDSLGRRSLRITTAQQLSNGAAITLSASGLNQLGKNETYPEVLTNGYVFDINGNTPLDATAHSLDRTRNKQLYAKIEHGDFKLSLVYGDRINQPSSALYSALFDDSGLKLRDTNLVINTSYLAEIAQDVMLFTNLNYHSYQYDGVAPYFNGVRYLDYEKTDARRLYGEINLRIKRWQDHTLLIGIDAAKDIKNKLYSYDETAVNPPYINSNNLDTQKGIYVQDAWKFANNWQLNTGARFDHSIDNDNHFSHRLGVIWQANPTLTLKALSGRAFRTSRQIDPVVATSTTGEFLDNPNIKSESMLSNELILEWRKNNQLEISTSLYRNKLSRIIGYSVDENDDFLEDNLFSIHTLGLETNALYRFTNQWKLNASYSLQRSELSDGSRADNSANWIAKLIVDGPVWQNKLFAAWELHANGPVSQDWYGTKAHLGTSVISNLALTAPNILPKLELQLRINNLFDRDEMTLGNHSTATAYLPAFGRNAMLRMTYAF